MTVIIISGTGTPSSNDNDYPDVNCADCIHFHTTFEGDYGPRDNWCDEMNNEVSSIVKGTCIYYTDRLKVRVERLLE